MRKILGKVAARGVGSGYTVSIRNANSALEQRIPGFQVVRRVAEFLQHTDAGSKFVFGDPGYTAHFFAFAVSSIIKISSMPICEN